MNNKKNIIVEPKQGKPFLLDLFYQENKKGLPIVVFAHGFKGFKDWGIWDKVAESFAEAGFFFVKFNFSHNGTTLTAPEKFDDLEAFGHNNYSKEYNDIQAVMDWLETQTEVSSDLYKLDEITLIGHSRGGGMAIAYAAQSVKIKKLITWASVSALDYAWNDEALLEIWQKRGVFHILNGRTKQEMPLYFQLYEDYHKNLNLFDLKIKVPAIKQPWLIIHGTEDPAVPLTAAMQLKEMNPSAELKIIDGANHVFGGSHPFNQTDLPEHSLSLIKTSIGFLNNSYISKK